MRREIATSACTEIAGPDLSLPEEKADGSSKSVKCDAFVSVHSYLVSDYDAMMSYMCSASTRGRIATHCMRCRFRH